MRRTPSANIALVYASYYNGTDFDISKEQRLDVVDRVGSADAFSAGFVYSVLHDFSVKNTIKFSIISSALKHTIKNDINFSTVREIKSIIQSQGCDVIR